MLPSDDPKHQLRQLFNLRTPAVGEPPKELENSLVARMQRRTPKAAPRRSFWSFLGDHRWAIAGLALTVGACRLPIDYQRSFGASVECSAEATAIDEAALNSMSEDLRVAIGAESIALRIFRTDDDAHVRLDVWGDLEDEDEALTHVLELAPSLKEAQCEAEALEGTVHGTLGGRLGYNLLDLDLLDRRGAAATREAILEKLAAEGFRGTAKVEIEDSDGQRKVKISIEERIELDENGHPVTELGTGETLEIVEEFEVEREMFQGTP